MRAICPRHIHMPYNILLLDLSHLGAIHFYHTTNIHSTELFFEQETEKLFVGNWKMGFVE